MDGTTDLQEASCKKLFGEYPEDVIAPIKSAADGLAQLEEIFITIAREATDDRNGFRNGHRLGFRIKRLAEAGAYLAFDIGNCTGHQYETMLQRLVEQGIVSKRGAV